MTRNEGTDDLRIGGVADWRSTGEIAVDPQLQVRGLETISVSLRLWAPQVPGVPTGLSWTPYHKAKLK